MLHRMILTGSFEDRNISLAEPTAADGRVVRLVVAPASFLHFFALQTMKIEEYKTAVGHDIPELDKEVNELIQGGFEPYGQPYFETWEIDGKVDTHGFFQPMVKKSN